MIIKHKYHAQITEVDNIKFGSKKESAYYSKLKLAQQSGELLFFLRQVPFDLPGGIKYRADFMCFWKDGLVEVIDVKGFMTELARTKIAMVKDLYKIDVRIV